jgi:hypothetical protein
MRTNFSTERVFTRKLPGGGFAAIDVTVERSMLRRPRYRGALVVERRANGSRDGTPPVIARATGISTESVVQQLLPTAQSNPAIGTAMLRRDLVAR